METEGAPRQLKINREIAVQHTACVILSLQTLRPARTHARGLIETGQTGLESAVAPR